jgi:2-polyprenyl-3-methyl-5-hydroxy-6-metoxy-1,4-benzoquinol methylase
MKEKEYSDLYNDKLPDYYENAREDIVSFIPKKAKYILDVGCGTGTFGKLLKEKDSNLIVWGVEPNKMAAKIAIENLDKVFNSIFNEELNFQNQNFDCICFNDVLEHLINPKAALDCALKFLNSNGCIIASIPNVRCYTVLKDLIWHGEWKYKKSGILDATHVRFFTKQSIYRLFKESGLKIISLQTMGKVNSRLLKLIGLFRLKKFNDISYEYFVVQSMKND